MSIDPTFLLLIAILLGGPVDRLDGPAAGEPPPGSVQMGTVYFDPENQEVVAVGWFNLVGGFIEYVACLPGIKSHETIVSLDCDPVDLKAALLLLGVEEAPSPESDRDLRFLEGERLMLRLQFPIEDSQGRALIRDIRVEDCVLNAPMEREMARCGFLFTGSRFVEIEVPAGTGEGEATVLKEEFGARLTGELVAICHRPYAILDNPLALPYIDGDYYAYPGVLPLLERDVRVPVSLVIRAPNRGEIDRGVTRMELPPRVLEESQQEDGMKKE